MPIAKKDVKTVNDLQCYLQEQTDKAERLYHYTTYESLLCILKNKCFRLSRMDLLNDKAEIKLGKSNEHIRNYIMSFTREKEYVSMWAMYGKASGIKLRLDFPKEQFSKVINNNFYFDPQLTNKIPLYNSVDLGHFSKKDYLISDIVYIDKRSNELRHNENKFSGIVADSYLVGEMSGFIKYDAWEFERETRLKVRLYNNLNNAEVPRYLFAGINDNLIQSFHVTFNPWISSEMKNEIKKSICNLSGFNIDCDDSANDGEITEL